MKNMRQQTTFNSDLFWLFTNEYLGDDLLYEHAQIFNDKIHRIPENKLTYRTLNHWASNDLISDNRPKGEGWHKFSLSEITWILIMKELRRFNFPLSKIRKVKESLAQYKDLKGISETPYLDFHCLYAFYTKTPISLYVFTDGEAILSNSSVIILNKQFFGLDNYIEIDLNRLLAEVFPKKDMQAKYGNLIYCSDKELNVLEKLKADSLQSLNITLKDGQPFLIEKTQLRSAEKGINPSFQYGRIEAMLHEGKLTGYKETIKERI